MEVTLTHARQAAPRPVLPAGLERLQDLAENLRWSWHHETVALFQALDPAGWEATGHNPVQLLARLPQERLAALARDEAFLARLRRLVADLDGYLASGSVWFRERYPDAGATLVAYFSAEFGITECLPIFSGGLGVLAGDHLKSASDLGVPLVGVGLLYRDGYFRQHLDATGYQRERYDATDFHALPLRLERDAHGAPLLVSLALPGRTVQVQIWRARVGRVALFLLDTNLPENQPADREITARLYGGDQETRIQQELVLGIGGYRALAALGLQPTVYHMNEGHAAFLAVEHIRALMRIEGADFTTARRRATDALVFTTHTPVPAGHDYFPPPLMERYFAAYSAALGIAWPDFLALGRQHPDDASEYFCMTVLALKLARRSNGVSKLHGAVSRAMWRPLWPERAEADVPIGAITNGVHLPTWTAPAMAACYTRWLGPGWSGRSMDPATWHPLARVPDDELWREREAARARLVAFARERLVAQLTARGATEAALAAARQALDPGVLTIGFARRFATYKRATLLLRDPERLARLLTNPERPVQFVFAGKAHPRDEGGKALIQRLAELAGQPAYQGRLVFIEDYDVAIARELVAGADVWLNTPQRPYEASGTSGMKATVNGLLNLGTLDGWWAEAWSDFRAEARPFGWAIGTTADYDDAERQAADDAEALYQVLEREVVPTFYERDARGIPTRWTAMMVASIGTLCPYFNTDRMVREYVERDYLPTGATTGRASAGW